jgi:type IV pilus assembly protein PilZ
MSEAPSRTPAAAPAGAPAAARPSVIQLVFREKGALYAAYMPVFAEGGLFVPTTREYKLGEDMYLLLSLPEDPQRPCRRMPPAGARKVSACVSRPTRRAAA